MAKSPKAHAIMISIPFQGHINPYIHLCLKLASMGFTITFVHHESIHHKLSKAHSGSPNEVDFFFEARQSGLDIHYLTISDGLPLDFDREAHFEEYLDHMVRDFPARVDEFVGKIVQSEQSVGPYFLVGDTIYAWAATIAEKYNLVNVSFWTQPALVFSLLYHLDLLGERGHFPCKDDLEEELDYIPGVAPISTKDLMPYLTTAESESAVLRALTTAFEEANRADFVLHNTVYELEAETLSALNKHQRNYAIGPINFSKNLPTNTLSQSLWSESDTTQWLDSKPPGSVIFVSFGSLVQTSKHVIEEIAYGLLLSEVNFIWVVREGIIGNSDANVLPDRFEDEVKDRGLIIPWCNQIMVLSNRAVGGFLTHCGWNSTIESMWCGVPMICYPITYDQPTNRKLVVDDWKIGINLCDDKYVARKEVAEKLKKFMSGSVGEGLKHEADKVKAILHDAMEGDGSSERNFEQFVNDLKHKIDQRTNKVLNKQ